MMIILFTFQNNTEKINSLLFIKHEKMNMCLISSLTCLLSGFLLSLYVSHSVLKEIFSMNLNLLITLVVANGYAPASDVFCLLWRFKLVEIACRRSSIFEYTSMCSKMIQRKEMYWESTLMQPPPPSSLKVLII